MQNIIYPDAEYIVITHKVLVNIGKKKGQGGMQGFMGGKGIKDIESLLYFIKQDEYYPTFADKLGFLMYSLNKDHIFLDGNKRISIYATIYFLQINIKDNIDLLESIVRKLEEIALKVTNNEISLEELKKIFCDFLKISI